MRFSSTRRSQSKEPKQEFNDSFELSQFSTISELLAGAQSDILEIFNSQNSSNKAKLWEIFTNLNNKIWKLCFRGKGAMNTSFNTDTHMKSLIEENRDLKADIDRLTEQMENYSQKIIEKSYVENSEKDLRNQIFTAHEIIADLQDQLKDTKRIQVEKEGALNRAKADNHIAINKLKERISELETRVQNKHNIKVEKPLRNNSENYDISMLKEKLNLVAQERDNLREWKERFTQYPSTYEKTIQKLSDDHDAERHRLFEVITQLQQDLDTKNAQQAYSFRHPKPKEAESAHEDLDKVKSQLKEVEEKNHYLNKQKQDLESQLENSRAERLRTVEMLQNSCLDLQDKFSQQCQAYENLSQQYQDLQSRSEEISSTKISKIKKPQLKSSKKTENSIEETESELEKQKIINEELNKENLGLIKIKNDSEALINQLKIDIGILEKESKVQRSKKASLSDEQAGLLRQIALLQGLVDELKLTSLNDDKLKETLQIEISDLELELENCQTKLKIERENSKSRSEIHKKQLETIANLTQKNLKKKDQLIQLENELKKIRNSNIELGTLIEKNHKENTVELMAFKNNLKICEEKNREKDNKILEKESLIRDLEEEHGKFANLIRRIEEDKEKLANEASGYIDNIKKLEEIASQLEKNSKIEVNELQMTVQELEIHNKELLIALEAAEKSLNDSKSSFRCQLNNQELDSRTEIENLQRELEKSLGENQSIKKSMKGIEESMSLMRADTANTYESLKQNQLHIEELRHEKDTKIQQLLDELSEVKLIKADSDSKLQEKLMNFVETSKMNQEMIEGLRLKLEVSGENLEKEKLNIKILEISNENLEKEKEILEKERDTLTKQIEELMEMQKEEAKSYKIRNLTLENEIGELNSDIQELVSEVNCLKDEIQDNNTQISALNSHLTALSSDLEYTKTHLSLKTLENTQLVSEMASMQSDFTSKINEIALENTLLLTCCNDLENSTDITQQNSNMETNLVINCCNDLETSLETLSGKYRNLENDNRINVMYLKQMEFELKKQHDNLTTKDNVILSLNEEIQSKSLTIDSLLKDLENLRRDQSSKTEISDILNGKNKEIQDLNSRIKELLQLYQTESSKMTHILAENGALKQEISELNADKLKTSDDNEILNIKISKSTRELETLHKEINDLNAELEKLEKNYDNSKENLKKLKTLLSESQLKNENLTETNGAFEANLKDAKISIDTLQNYISSKDSEIASLKQNTSQNSASNFEAEKSNLSAENLVFKIQISEKDQYISKLTEALTENKEKFEATIEDMKNALLQLEIEKNASNLQIKLAEELRNQEYKENLDKHNSEARLIYEKRIEETKENLEKINGETTIKLQIEREKLDTKYSTILMNMDDLKNENNRLRQELDQILTEKEGIIIKIVAENKKLTHDLDSLTQKYFEDSSLINDNLKQDHLDLTQKYSQTLDRLNNATQAVSSLSSSLHLSESTIQDLTAKNSDLQSSLDQSNKDLKLHNDLLSNSIEINSLLNIKNEAIHELEQEIFEINENLNTVSIEKENLRLKKEKIQSENEVLSCQVEELKAAFNNLELEYIRKDQELNDTSKELVKLIEDFEKCMKAKQGEIEKIKANFEKTQEIRDLNQVIDDLHSSLAALQAKNSKLQEMMAQKDEETTNIIKTLSEEIDYLRNSKDSLTIEQLDLQIQSKNSEIQRLSNQVIELENELRMIESHAHAEKQSLVDDLKILDSKNADLVFENEQLSLKVSKNRKDIGTEDFKNLFSPGQSMISVLENDEDITVSPSALLSAAKSSVKVCKRVRYEDTVWCLVCTTGYEKDYTWVDQTLVADGVLISSLPMIEEDDFINQMQHLSDAYENLEREKLDLLDKLRDRELNSQLIQQIEDLIPQEMEKNIGD